MLFYQSNNCDFTLHQGDSLQLLKTLPDGAFRCIFADPPYFLSNGGISCQSGKQVCVDKGDWDKGGTPEYIYEFNKQWLSICREKLTDDGTIWISGTHHNIHVVMRCLQELGYKILNTITWQKSDPPPNLSCRYFNFSTELIIWARKYEKRPHHFNYETMKAMNGGSQMTDVWRLPAVSIWEKSCGKHPTQKPLRLLYRILLASTDEGDLVLDPFAGSSTTGIAANLIGRRFIGIDQESNFLQLGKARREELNDPKRAKELLGKMQECDTEATVIVNHARTEARELMIEKGICYLRAGDSKGSLLVQKGFEQCQYVVLHTNGEHPQMFKLKTKGKFNIWTKETLEKNGFHPEHAPYYVVLPFENKKVILVKPGAVATQKHNTFTPKIRPLRDFI